MSRMESKPFEEWHSHRRRDRSGQGEGLERRVRVQSQMGRQRRSCTAAREQLAQNRCLGCGESGLVSLEGGLSENKGKLGRFIGATNKWLCFCLFAKQSLYIAPDCPETYYVDWTALELTESCLPSAGTRCGSLCSVLT